MLVGEILFLDAFVAFVVLFQRRAQGRELLGGKIIRGLSLRIEVRTFGCLAIPWLS